MPDTRLTTHEEQPYELVALDGDSPFDIVRVNLGGRPLRKEDLPTFKIPGGGGLQWKLDGLRGQEVYDEIVGCLILVQGQRSYYDKRYDGTGGAPACASSDGITGVPGVDGPDGTHYTNCQVCPKNQFDTALDGPGKACSEFAMCYVLRSGDALPCVVRISPGSLAVLDEFMRRLSAEMKRRDRVVIAIGLEDSKNYSRATFRLVEELSPDMAQGMETYIAGFRDLIRGTTSNLLIDQGVEPPMEASFSDAYADEPPPPTEAPGDIPFG